MLDSDFPEHFKRGFLTIDIKNRWQEYFYKLFNDGSESSTCELEDLTVSECEVNRLFYRRIRVLEVREALKRMENGKSVGPDGIPIEVWKCLGEEGVIWLTKLFNEILRSKKMPDGWSEILITAMIRML